LPHVPCLVRPREFKQFAKIAQQTMPDKFGRVRISGIMRAFDNGTKWTYDPAIWSASDGG